MAQGSLDYHDSAGPLQRFYRRHTNGVQASIILFPILGWWLFVLGVPTFYALMLAFQKYTNLMEPPTWHGIQNIIDFFRDPGYIKLLWNSIWIGLLAVGVCQLFGFGAALLMNLPIKGVGVYRTLWYIPAVTSAAATTQIFNLFISPTKFGVLNNVLQSIGLQPIVWNYSTGWMLFWIVAYSAWRGIGGAAILWIAGLQSVDPRLYEAAKIDGANTWQSFLYITIPGLRPFVTWVAINGCITGLQIYEPIVFISGGGPFGTTQVLMYRILRDLLDFNLGMAGTGSLVMLAVVFVLVAINWGMREKESV